MRVLSIGMPPTLVVASLACTCIMHGWMNFGAEITRFADREFYLVRLRLVPHIKAMYLIF